ncbi:hypothetical protein EV426DRAFT_606682 [Tirmania nivea]|nr:hypothetical protein EV426DRAFT_606682 [Tirmania nivea]
MAATDCNAPTDATRLPTDPANSPSCRPTFSAISPDTLGDMLLTVQGSLPPQFHPVLAPLAALLPRDTPVSIPVKKLTYQRIVAVFGLIFSDHYLDRESHFVQIPRQGENDVLDMELINHACLGPLLRFNFLYGSIFPRETEAACRIAVDHAILEAIAITSRMADDWRSATQPPDSTLADIEQNLRNLRCRTPTHIARRVQCFAELKITSPVHRQQDSQVSKAVVYTGRADYAVSTRDPATNRLTSYLILVEAKNEALFTQARSEVLGYVACIWEGRKKKCTRKDCTTYGLATDGLKWQVVMIDHDGVVKEGKLLDAKLDGWSAVLQMLVALIKRAGELQTPKNSPQRPGYAEAGGEIATAIDDGDQVQHEANFLAHGETLTEEDGDLFSHV